jgi:CDP-diacylglycerol--serine O-phosphatidyltransferase
LALLPLLVSQDFGDDFFRHPAVTGPWIVAMALLMVSQVPTYSLKQLRVPQRMVLPMLVLIGLLAAGLAGAPWLTLLVISLIYLGSFPFSVLAFRKLKREAEAAAEESESTDDGEEPTDEPGPPHLREV